MTPAFDESIFWPAFKAAGMLLVASIKQTGAPKKDVDVGFKRPGQVLAVGVISTDYEIEYQSADLPKLTEGDPVTIGAEKFKVRETPLVEGDGFFSIALLTKL